MNYNSSGEGDGDHKWQRGDSNWSKFTHLDPKANFIHKQADAAIQHKFTYADDFSKTITDILKEPYLCLQITEDIIKLKDQFKYNFFIVGKKDFVNDYIKFLRNLKLSN